MNQISGKIVRIALHQQRRHYFAKHTGQGHNVSGGVCFWNMQAYEYIKNWLCVQRVPQFFNNKTMKYDYALPSIRVNYLFKFYSNLRNKFQTSNSYIMKNAEIPFEFFVQPALPIFATIVPTQDNNVSFQQIIKDKS